MSEGTEGSRVLYLGCLDSDRHSGNDGPKERMGKWETIYQDGYPLKGGVKQGRGIFKKWLGVNKYDKLGLVVPDRWKGDGEMISSDDE